MRRRTDTRALASRDSQTRALDAAAEVQVDLAPHRVRIDSAAGDAALLSDAIEQTGYTPVAV